MDPTASPPPELLLPSDDEWDADGFEIPSLNKNKIIVSKKEKLVESPNPAHQKKPLNTENLYLGPHGAKTGLKSAPQNQQQEIYSGGKKQRLKQKIRDAEQRSSSNGYSFGRENKVEILRDLVGGKSALARTPKNAATGEWLDPHCHEAQFEKSKARN